MSLSVTWYEVRRHLHSFFKNVYFVRNIGELSKEATRNEVAFVIDFLWLSQRHRASRCDYFRSTSWGFLMRYVRFK
jgi:hypothetical protein